MRALSLALVLVLLAGVPVAGCTSGPAEDTAAPEAPAAAPGSPEEGAVSETADLVRDVCTGCHSLDRVRAAAYDEDGWLATVSRMRSNGAQLNDQEAQEIAAFLAEGGGSEL